MKQREKPKFEQTVMEIISLIYFFTKMQLRELCNLSIFCNAFGFPFSWRSNIFNFERHTWKERSSQTSFSVLLLSQMETGCRVSSGHQNMCAAIHSSQTFFCRSDDHLGNDRKLWGRRFQSSQRLFIYNDHRKHIYYCKTKEIPASSKSQIF